MFSSFLPSLLYCTVVERYCYVTGSILISFPISRSTGVSVATAYKKNTAPDLEPCLWKQKKALELEPFRFHKSSATLCKSDDKLLTVKSNQ